MRGHRAALPALNMSMIRPLPAMVRDPFTGHLVVQRRRRTEDRRQARYCRGNCVCQGGKYVEVCHQKDMAQACDLGPTGARLLREAYAAGLRDGLRWAGRT